MNQFVRPVPSGFQPMGKLKKALIMLLAGVVIATPLVLIVKHQSELVIYGYKVIEVGEQNEALRGEQNRLRTELAQLKRPDQIIRNLKKLNLEPVPLERQILVKGRAAMAEDMVAQAGPGWP